MLFDSIKYEIHFVLCGGGDPFSGRFVTERPFRGLNKMPMEGKGSGQTMAKLNRNNDVLSLESVYIYKTLTFVIQLLI